MRLILMTLCNKRMVITIHLCKSTSNLTYETDLIVRRDKSEFKAISRHQQYNRVVDINTALCYPFHHSLQNTP